MNDGQWLPPESSRPCDYRERERTCPDPAVWEVSISGNLTGLCERHSRPEFHPPDLHKRLPGKVTRALRRPRA